MLLALDVSEFGGDGRAVLSYGADPYTAESVSWHVPGVASTVDSMLGFNATSALHHLQAVQQQNPGLSAASIAWIGYDAPSGWSIARAAGHGMARTGGDILYSDIRAFNAARDALAGDGSHFAGNHVFGYSYGSTTTGYAGRDGRFAGHVRTVSLVGSPGAGPVRTAGEFGIGAENVFAASSARDVVTALGGRGGGSNGRILGIGLGTDPAMDSFGAVRLTAEPAASMNRPLTGGTHHTYFLNTEATTNLGRVAAGRTDAVTTEQHRTELGRSRHAPVLRTVEPAGDRVGGRRFWNVLWRRPPNCAVTVTEELSSLFEGRTFGLDVRPSRRGVPARALFRAVGADARFATYDEVEATLLGDPSLRVAVLTSQWAGGPQGGHAYLAVKVDGKVQLYDPHTRKYSPWPPHWGQHAVSQTAVGYLQTNGKAVGPMTVDVPLQLDAADAVGNVQGPQADPDFARKQAEYRAQDPATRLVDTRYAEPLGDVVDNASDRARVLQLAKDLSGWYGPYRIHFRAENLPGDVLLTGDIFHGDKKIGTTQRSFDRDGAGNLVAYHTGLVIDEKLPDGTPLRGKGFSKAVTYELERLYVRSGFDRIHLMTHDEGTFAFARRGYAWDPSPDQLQQSLDRVKQSARKLRETVSDEARALLDQVVSQLDPSNPRLPEPIDLSNLATREEPDLGRRLLDGAAGKHGNGVHYVKYLDPASVAPGPTGLKGWLKNLFGRENAPSPALDNCAYGVAGELSRIYPGRFAVPIAPSRTGVPAWALFEAAQARSEFATHDDIETELLGRPAGSSAIVVSRWVSGGAQQEAHAYLAVTDGRQVQLYDPRTKQYSPWPPEWVDAVDRTAVGYLNENGEAIRPLHDVPLQLGMRAADSVGDVKGHPEPGPDDFASRQAEYRDQDRTTRRVDTRYADPIDEVVDSISSGALAQLGEDLSGLYGRYRVELEAYAFEQVGLALDGSIFEGDREVGVIAWSYERDDANNLVAHHEIHIHDTNFRGREFYKSLVAELAPYYAQAGVDRITSVTHGASAYAAADIGETWDLDPARLVESFENLKTSAELLRPSLSAESRAVLDDVIARLHPAHPRMPEPVDLAHLSTRDEPELGRRLLEGTAAVLDGTGINYVHYLWNPRLGSSQNCANWVADAVSHRYGIQVQLAVEPTERGVPARALFEAVGSRADFATYDDIAEFLLRDEVEPGKPGPAAVVVSSWAGGESHGGHAYLAVRDGDQIYLLDSFTGERLGWPPYWAEDSVSHTAVGYLDSDGNPMSPLDGAADQLVAADAVGHVQGPGFDSDPVRALGLPDHASGTLSEGQSIAAFTQGEARMRELNDQLAEAGVSTEERARRLSELRNSLRAWAYDLMSNREAAEFLARATVNPTFEDLVARNAERGLTGDAIFEAIIDSSTHSRLAPGSLTDIETGAVYSQFELGLRSLNEQLVRDGVSAEDRARQLSGLRSSLRSWTRELMENRAAADWMAANESNPSFEDLVARYERKGLTGDDVYNAIIDAATHSHYSAGTLTNEETRTVYTNYELRMRELRDQLLRDWVSVEERARTMYGMRATIRSWTRSLMADRATADWLNENEQNPTFEDLVERNRAKGRVGDEIYEAIIASSTRSRGSVNEELGIDPDNPPDLPRMRGPDDGGPQDQDQEGDTT
nr:alpha/beta hydrolase [Mycolicibacterium porcinum]